MTDQADAAARPAISSPESGYLTLSQVAIRTGRHPELLRQWCAAGRLPCARVGGSWVMLERDVA
ncbi:MAG: helix-turn-helix domain-containing protein, partial [Chloroflexota bacterium]|nr:helix-turn-helix domain-containing protein [Chloroflexota bacterium]